MSDGKLGTGSTLSKKKKRNNCTICRDVFQMPEDIYSTHRGNSSKCPNNKNNMPSKKSQLDQTVKSEPSTQDIPVSDDKNDEEESQTIADNSDHNESDSDNDLSTYTNAHTYDEDSFLFMDRKQSNEPIHPGDVIEYYSPIGVAGDPRWLRHARVEAVDPVNSYIPLVLDNGEGIPSTTSVKRIRILKDNIILDHPGIFRSLDQFKMKKQGETTMGDVMTRNAADFKGRMKQHIRQGMETCTKEGGLAIVDIFHKKLFSGNKDMESSDVSAVPAVEYQSHHQTFDQGLAIMQAYGHVKDVPGDGSCGYHALILLLQRMDIIDKNKLVRQFRRNIYNHIQQHMAKFTGADGGRCVYEEYSWGKYDQDLKKARNPMVRRERFMTTEVMRGIWDRKTDFCKYVSQLYWMDATYLLPIITHMDKIARLVLYDIRKLIDGTRYFTTYIYCYDPVSCCVSRDVRDGFIHDVNPSGSGCIVFIHDRSHYMLFHHYDNDSELSQSDSYYQPWNPTQIHLYE
jgi:hypothetical protein